MQAHHAASGEAAAFGHAGNPEAVSRTVEVGMSDAMRFTPAAITMKAGQTVKFVVSNRGKLLHEMMKRRALLSRAAMLALLGSRPAFAAVDVQVYKNPDCGCCTGWVDQLKAAG